MQHSKDKKTQLNNWIKINSKDKILNHAISDEKIIKLWKKENRNFNDVKEQLNRILKTHFQNKYKFIFSKLINDYDFLKMIIKSGTIGVLRGKVFANYIKEIITKNYKDNPKILIKKEFMVNKHINEISDFYVKNQENGKEVVIMVQIDLWKRGQQINRLSKYINLALEIKSKSIKQRLYCVIGRSYEFKNLESKVSKCMEKGILNNIIFYPKNLINGINSFLFENSI